MNESGASVESHEALDRIKELAIPPAWSEVHISPSPRSRLQAIGLDGKGKAQYLYHPGFAARQALHKFEKIERFGDQLGRLRKVTNEHLRLEGLPRERVLAIVVRLINSLYFRVGSEAGVKRNRTYGVTTLRERHLRVDDEGRLIFNFSGKHHVHHRGILVDETLAKILRELRGLGGPHLFEYYGADGRLHPISGHDVNEYLQAAMGEDYTAKDFRTWHGTMMVAKELAKLGPAPNERQRQKNLVLAVRNAAARLGNTPAVCRRSYLHPAIIKLYGRGITLTDVPPNHERIEAVQEQASVEELQLLEMFHIARVLEAAERERRSKTRTAAPLWAHVAPATTAPLGSPNPSVGVAPRPDQGSSTGRD